MDVDLFSQCHVFLEARHCTTKDEKKGKLFSVGYIPLVGEGGTIIDNTLRSVSLFKPNVKPKDVAYYLKPETAALKFSRELSPLFFSLSLKCYLCPHPFPCPLLPLFPPL